MNYQNYLLHTSNKTDIVYVHNNRTNKWHMLWKRTPRSQFFFLRQIYQLHHMATNSHQKIFLFLFCDKHTNYKARLYNGTVTDSTCWDFVSGSLKDTGGKKLLQDIIHKTQIKLVFHIKEIITILYCSYVKLWFQYYLLEREQIVLTCTLRASTL